MTNNTADLLAKVVNNNDTDGLLRSILSERQTTPSFTHETITLTTNVSWDGEDDNMMFTPEDMEQVKERLADFVEGLGIIGGEVTLNITHTL